MVIELRSIVPWGRSLAEYRAMFALSPADLGGRILGCGDGPASFNAEATALGYQVVSCDPIYRFSAGEIESRFDACYDDLVEQVRRQSARFVWRLMRDPDDMGRHRRAALQRFLQDFRSPSAGDRYVAAALPGLPFADGQFDLALVSHLLFLYSVHLGWEFHRQAVAELLRVAREVRIFPLLTLAQEISPLVAPLCDDLRQQGLLAERVTVDYEFQRGGNQMLRITRP